MELEGVDIIVNLPEGDPMAVIFSEVLNEIKNERD